MKNLIITAVVSLILFAGCNSDKKEPMNPFLTEYDTPFGVPPFELIENEHFIPAFEEGIRQQEAEIDMQHS